MKIIEVKKQKPSQLNSIFWQSIFSKTKNSYNSLNLIQDFKFIYIKKHFSQSSNCVQIWPKMRFEKNKTIINSCDEKNNSKKKYLKSRKKLSNLKNNSNFLLSFYLFEFLFKKTS